MAYSLDSIFGDGVGASYEERARSSTKIFVRSQAQLAEFSEGATGRKLTALEALRAYGIEALDQVAAEGAAPLLSTIEEPSRSIRIRRQQLNLSRGDLARAAQVSSEDIERAETPGIVTPVRVLERIAIALALDERVLGFLPTDPQVTDLGVRLREMAEQWDTRSFSAHSVLRLSEAAWVIDRQAQLCDWLGVAQSPAVLAGRMQSKDYSYPAWQKGYVLAERARREFNLGPDEPIASLRSLLERKLGVPLVQDELDNRFAGATIANGQSRGIVVNDHGKNSNVWIRRMTLAHEVGHLIGDTDENLNRLRVDEYDHIDSDIRSQRDVVEMRANGFAVAFLAPPRAVKKIAESSNLAEVLERVTCDFGISRTAATYHIRNVASVDVSGVRPQDVTENSEEWRARENLALDYFPLQATPLSRRGLFAYYVVRAEREKVISTDTAAGWLNATIDDYGGAADTILDLMGGTETAQA